MSCIDYAKLTHRLEGAIDEAIEMLHCLPHPQAQRVREKLIGTLLHTEEQIIREQRKIIPFPKLPKSEN